MKLAAIVVMYQPDKNELIENILSIIHDVDTVLIWQNSLDETLKFAEPLSEFKQKIIFLGNGNNVGIATALNGGVRWVIDNHYTHLLTLDQDSKFEGSYLADFKRLIQESTIPSVGIYGINPKSWDRLLYQTNDPYMNVMDTITSGSIFPVEVFIKYGLFEDDLFIDAVDYEYCYRLKSKGLKTIIYPSIILNHKVGAAKKTWLGFKTDNYSSFRTYYLIRNHTAIWRRYPKYFSNKYKVGLIKIHILARIVKIVLGEDNKAKKISSIFLGLYHGLKNKSGFYKI